MLDIISNTMPCKHISIVATTALAGLSCGIMMLQYIMHRNMPGNADVIEEMTTKLRKVHDNGAAWLSLTSENVANHRHDDNTSVSGKPACTVP